MNLIRAGVVGLGRAGMKHALTYSQLPFVDLVAVCDTNHNTASSAAERLGVQSCTSLDEFFERADIDAVSIVVPDHLHLVPLEKAIQAKKTHPC